MSADVFKTIENIINVPYVSDSFETGAVCLAQDEELRAEFQAQFTSYDVVNYVYGVLQLLDVDEKQNSIGLFSIPYPVNADFFWKNSNLGKQLRLENPIPELEYGDVSNLNWE